MENSIVTLSVYFEIKDSAMYGGEGSIGYASTSVDLKIASLENANILEYIENQQKGMAEVLKVDIDKVRVIPRTEYAAETEDEEGLLPIVLDKQMDKDGEIIEVEWKCPACGLDVLEEAPCSNFCQRCGKKLRFNF